MAKRALVAMMCLVLVGCGSGVGQAAEVTTTTSAPVSLAGFEARVNASGCEAVTKPGRYGGPGYLLVAVGVDEADCFDPIFETFEQLGFTTGQLEELGRAADEIEADRAIYGQDSKASMLTRDDRFRLDRWVYSAFGGGVAYEITDQENAPLE